jgi:hypothetical protein
MRAQALKQRGEEKIEHREDPSRQRIFSSTLSRLSPQERRVLWASPHASPDYSSGGVTWLAGMD